MPGNRANYGLYFRKFRQGSRNFYENIAVAYTHGKSLDFHVFIGVIKTGPAVELKAVPWAHQVISIQVALAERAARVWTSAVHTVQLAVNIAKRVRSSFQFKFDNGAGRQFREGPHSNQWHIQYDNGSAAKAVESSLDFPCPAPFFGSRDNPLSLKGKSLRRSSRRYARVARRMFKVRRMLETK